MIDHLRSLRQPELVIGVAGPIGVQISWLEDSLANSLRAVNYRIRPIKLTVEMMSFPAKVATRGGIDYFSDVKYKMDYATELCRKSDDAAFLARLAIRAIQRERNSITGAEKQVPDGVAYIVRQLKRPQEVSLLRQVYGKQFLLVSAHGSVGARASRITEQIRRYLSAEKSSSEIEKLARDLIERDADETSDAFGQHLRDTFHMADVFVGGMDKTDTEQMTERFIQAFFGRTDIAPSKSEYGMYAAKSASLRSSDLSRQVGAAIFTNEGEIVSQGCNEVPKSFGGTYWDLEKPDFRDVKIGHDPNEQLKNEILRDLFTKLQNADYLAKSITEIGSISEMVEAATKRSSSDGSKAGPLSNALIMDLTEYGRVVHAEMCAICDAARLGRSTKGAVLFCTTFPCHNCTKHILAAGIRQVVYMEPYPKSRAKDLHQNEIEIEEISTSKVAFIPFLGISPARYKDIFQKGKRKTTSGSAMTWLKGEPVPMLDVVFPAYTQNENFVVAGLVVDFA